MSVIERETTKTVTKRDLLLRAADILEEFDWQQGSAGSRASGSMCAVGAINEARRDFGSDSVEQAWREACGMDGFPPSCGIWPLAFWNDAPGRTKREVIDRLREAAS